MVENGMEQGGRVNQKRRTRAAILAAASELMGAGTLPSVAEAADAAQVSRATAYRYFPTQEHLLQEIALDSASREVDAVLAAIPEGGAAPERLDAVVRAVFHLVSSNDLAFRTLLRLSLEPKAGGEGTGQGARRGGRRLRWLEAALAPLGAQLGAERMARLVSALALTTGIETQVVLRDICDLDDAEAEEVTCWAAQALLRAALSDDA